MIALPRRLADAGAQFRPGAAPDFDGAELVVANVVAAGGDEALFGRALASAHATAGALDGARLRDAIAWAAWRSGALALRDDALARLDRALDDGSGPIVAAALGLRPDTVAAFAHRQRTDRFWWPDRADHNGYVLSVGGFAGFGGAWIRPPDHVQPLGHDAFALRVADEWWRLDADVWCARLRRIEEPDARGAAPGAPAEAAAQPSAVTIVIDDETHLAWLHARDRA